ncbi:hypothetical protein Tco_1076010 [Tanacetum coccineum]
MDEQNMTMEEYIKLEEEKARRRGRVFNWQISKYGKIRVDDDLYELRSMEAEFPAIVIDDAFTPQDALPCKSQAKIWHHYHHVSRDTHFLDTRVLSILMRILLTLRRGWRGFTDERYTGYMLWIFKGLFARMVMEHHDDLGVVVFTSQACLFWPWDYIPGRKWSPPRDLHDYWRGISTDEDFLGPPHSHTLIRDPVLRLCHRMMAYIIAGRSQAPKKVIVTDLFYLRGLDVRSFNISYLLARYLRRFAAGRKSRAHIFGGQFVARLAKHFGLLTAKILGGLTIIAPKLPIIDMGELARLQICMKVDDTWAWVAIGPERQPDATTGALAVAEDALAAADEGRLEEEVQGLRRYVRSLRGLVKRSMTDQGRFSTWMMSCMAQLIDANGLTYQAFDGTF